MKIKKILSIIGCPILAGGAIATIPLISTSCGNSDSSTRGLLIDASNTTNYLVTGDIYTKDAATKITIGHKLLDLKKFADENNYSGNVFTISGEVDFGILVYFKQDVNLYGINNALIRCITIDEDSDAAVGVIVGSTIAPSQPISYANNMYIDPSVNARIISNSGNAYGTYFIDTDDNCTQTINGVFTVYTYSGVVVGSHFGGITNSVIKINGVFTVSTEGTSDACGVSVSTAKNNIEINGIFTVYSQGGDTNGVAIASIDSSSSPNICVGGTFTITCEDSISCGVLLSGHAYGTIEINGVFTLCSDNSNVIGVSVIGVGDASSLNVYGTFTLFAENGEAKGVSFDGAINGSLIGTPIFFSNKNDSGNWKTKGKSEYWNNDTATSVADGKLEIINIWNSTTNFNYRVIVIEDANPPDAQIYNTAYKNALLSYVNGLSSNCVAYNWLNDIINQINDIINQIPNT